MTRWLLHVLGVDNVSGPAYAWWSGAGSDVGELTMLAGLAAFLRHRNCHVHRCWRLGRHPVGGTGHVVCRRHHPTGAPQAHEIGGNP